MTSPTSPRRVEEMNGQKDLGASRDLSRAAVGARADGGAHTPGPWKRCGAARGGCTCGQVWCPDYPVAIVTRGDWGDGADLRRALRELWDHFRHRAFGFLAYGHISDDLAQANACLISAAPDLLSALRPLAECEIIECDEPLPDSYGARYLITLGEIRAARAAIDKALGREAASPAGADLGPGRTTE